MLGLWHEFVKSAHAIIAWCCGYSHAGTSCQRKVFFYWGNINSFLFLSCTPNILSENFPGRGGMPCIATLAERKVDGSPDDTAFKNDPSASISTLSLYFFTCLFPSHHNMTLSHIPEDTCSWMPLMIWLKIEHKKQVFWFIICSELWDWCHKDSFCAHCPFYFVLKRGWALAVVLRRRA